jgi:hypothetical protein
MTGPDYSTWLTKQEAAERIGVTTKTVERFVQAGQIQQARWQRDGRGPLLAVYFPDDVDRMALERQRGPLPPFLVPKSADVPTNGNGHGLMSTNNVLASTEPVSIDNDPIRQLFAAALRAVMSQTSQTSARIGGERLYLTLPEAAAWTGLTEAYLRRKCRDGSLPAIKDQGWKIKRTDLETL